MKYVKLLNDVNKDYYRQVKPILDEYQLEEFENKIHTAMEFASPVKFTVWEDGYDWEYTGMIHRLDSVTKMIHLDLEKEKGHIIRVKFEDLVAVVIRE
ncbi:YolD-like family protein [Vibrio vulnificus]|nr:YolD-like family protein [Vibrio vulnificus]